LSAQSYSSPEIHHVLAVRVFQDRARAQPHRPGILVDDHALIREVHAIGRQRRADAVPCATSRAAARGVARGEVVEVVLDFGRVAGGLRVKPGCLWDLLLRSKIIDSDGWI